MLLDGGPRHLPNVALCDLLPPNRAMADPKRSSVFWGKYREIGHPCLTRFRERCKLFDSGHQTYRVPNIGCSVCNCGNSSHFMVALGCKGASRSQVSKTAFMEWPCRDQELHQDRARPEAKTPTAPVSPPPARKVDSFAASAAPARWLAKN